MLIKNYVSILNSRIHYLTITHLNTLNGNRFTLIGELKVMHFNTFTGYPTISHFDI